MTYPEDYDRPFQYAQQGYGQQPRQDEPWHQHQHDPFADQRRPGPQQQPYGQSWPSQGQQGAPQPPPWQQQPASPSQPPKRQKHKPWPARHKALSGVIAFCALVVIIVAASASNKPSTTTSDISAAGSSASPPAAVSSAAASVPSTAAAPAGPSITDAQQQAVDSAESYLSEGQGFSRQGLLNQLTSSFGEGFSQSDAEFAVKYLNPNWDQQALDSANGYLGSGQGFSEQGLIQQLTATAGAGFTETQAEYAINHVHPDWDAQAVTAAQGYLGDGEGFSRSGLIQQLTSSYGAGFTEAQAEYAANKVMP